MATQTDITIFATVLAGNMGDGWGDPEEAAEAYADYLGTALMAYAAQHYPEKSLDVRIDVLRRMSGPGRPLDVVSTLDARKERALRDRLEDVADRAWENFGDTEAAQALFEE